MRIAVIGVGAIGGWLAASLARAGEEVSVVARGAHLAAIRAHGLKLIDAGGEYAAKVAAAERLGELGAQDCLVLGVKAHQLGDIAADVAAALGPQTTILAAQNGMPWWYFHGAGGRFDGRRLESVDPGGRIGALLPAERLIGSVVYAAGEIVAPGVIRHVEGNRFTARRTRRRDDAARRGAVEGAGKRRPQGARGRRHPLGNLDEALGQRDLQPGQRADPRAGSTACASSRLRGR